MRCRLILPFLALFACTGGAIGRDDQVSETPEPASETPQPGPADAGPGATDGSVDDTAAGTLHQAALEVMAANCTSCHNGSPDSFNGSLDLTAASMDTFADRLLDTRSAVDTCDGHRLVNVDSIGESLFLKLVASSTPRDAECIGKMPLGTDGLAEEDYAVLERWVAELVTVGLPNPRPVDDDVSVQQTSEAADPVSPLTALRKAKMLATGQVPTQQELDAVTDDNGNLDHQRLSELIDGWVRIDNEDFVARREMFFRSVLQQNGRIGKTNRQLVLTKLNDRQAINFYSNLNDMYVKTAEWIADQDRDFRTLFTDDWAMVTTGALVMMKMADWPLIRHKLRDSMTREIRTQGFKYILEQYTDNAQIQADTSDWRVVRLRFEPNPSQHNRDLTPFNNGDIITQMRAVTEGDEISLRVPRTICSSIAFFTAWETNLDNKFRGPMNQCVILALNSSFSPHDLTRHPDSIPPGLDPEAFPLDSTCYACHKNMEPGISAYTRHFDVSHNRYVAFTQLEVDEYNAQRAEHMGLDPNRHGHWMTLPSTTPPAPYLIYEGVNTPVANLKDWVRQLGFHPYFAKAWVHKLAQWALSEAVEPDDPEVVRLTEVFEASDFNFHSLFKAFLESKFVTHATTGEDANFAGNSVSVLLTNHYCHSMQVRLRDIRLGDRRTRDTPNHRSNLCGFEEAAAKALPKGGLDRGSIDLTLPKQSDAFSQISLEQVCNTAGVQLVGNGSATFLRSAAAVDDTVEDLVAGLLGFPASSPEHAEAKASFLHIHRRLTSSPECATADEFETALTEETPSCGLALGEQLAMETLVSLACQDPRTTSIGL